MTRSQMVRRGWAALITVTTLLLAACHGSGGGGNASLRLLNATSDLTSVDLYLNAGLTISGGAVDAVTGYTTVTAQTYSLSITSTGNPTSLFSNTWGFSKDQHYTGVVWGRNGSLSFATIPEDDDPTQITAGSGRIRVYNATANSGAIDVYLTQNLDDLSTASPTSGSVGSAQFGGFKELTATTYRLRVTTAGAPNDVRLDTSITVPLQQYATLIVTAGPSGFLVNGALLVEQGGITQLKNTKARLRVAAGADAAGTVGLNLDGTPVVAGLQSPFVGPYTLVNVGQHVADVQVDGTSLTNNLGAQTLASGGDYTVLVYGSGASGQSQLITDDNRLPSNGFYKIRLVNGYTPATLATLLIGNGYVSAASNVPLGSASLYTPFVSTPTLTGTEIDVLAGSVTLPPSLTAQNPSNLGVYTVFVLGGNPAQVVRLSKDR